MPGVGTSLRAATRGAWKFLKQEFGVAGGVGGYANRMFNPIGAMQGMRQGAMSIREIFSGPRTLRGVMPVDAGAGLSGSVVRARQKAIFGIAGTQRQIHRDVRELVSGIEGIGDVRLRKIGPGGKIATPAGYRPGVINPRALSQGIMEQLEVAAGGKAPSTYGDFLMNLLSAGKTSEGASFFSQEASQQISSILTDKAKQASLDTLKMRAGSVAEALGKSEINMRGVKTGLRSASAYKMGVRHYNRMVDYAEKASMKYGAHLATNAALNIIPALTIPTYAGRMIQGRAPWRDNRGKMDILPFIPLPGPF